MMKERMISRIRKIVLLTLLSLLFIPKLIACSGYKITVGNKTILGSNEDAWRMTPHIWFEKAKDKGEYGAAFTGSRWDGENGYAPQSGMNEAGLAFERLSAFHPKQKGFVDREKILNPTLYLKKILHTCKTVEQVKDYISTFDHSYFIEDIFIYVDKSGKYLIVEPYHLEIGSKASYVYSNFCPSITSEKDAENLDRYRKGKEYLKRGIDTSLAFCKALSDTMHVCRDKIGDGTLLSSIWDLKEGTVNLYFYHDFERSVKFNLREELRKGDHMLAIHTLFPKNSEFEQLGNYKIPKNNILIGIFIVASGAFFLLSSVFFLSQILRKRTKYELGKIQILMLPLSLVLFYYMLVLSGSINVFYFPAPYRDPSNIFVSLSSYVPFVVLLLIVPMLYWNIKILGANSWSVVAKGVFSLNNIIFLILIGLFAYWHFYDVFA